MFPGATPSTRVRRRTWIYSSAGPPSRRAADLIGTRLSDILEHATEFYDLIIMDYSLLIFRPEPLQMAAAADGVLVVALAGQTHRKALGSVINILARLRANVIGVVLNSVRATSAMAIVSLLPLEILQPL